MKYRAICNNTTRIIDGCNTPSEALQVAIDSYNNCLDHTDDIEIYTMAGDYVIGEQDGKPSR